MTRTFDIALLVLIIAGGSPALLRAQALAPPGPAAAAPADDALDLGAPLAESDPAIRAALELPRDEPADFFQAVLWLIDLGRAELAKPILEELSQLQLTDAQRAELVAQFGSHSMLRLAQTEALAPAGAAFARAAMDAAAAAAADPQRIAALIEQLTDPSPEVRQLAASDLAAVGEPAVVATLEALARTADPAARRHLMAGAARMAPLVVDPLLAMLETSDPRLRADVQRLLRHLKVPQAAPWIADDPLAAEGALRRAIDRHRRGTPNFAADELEQVRLWQWHDDTKTLTAESYPAPGAETLWLARLASELARLRPDQADYVRQAIVLGLEAESIAHAAQPGEDVPPTSARDPQLAAWIDAASAHQLNDALASALEAGFSGAAQSLARLVGQRNQVDVLYTHDAQPSPLANALLDPDRSVRFAALATIMALDPTSPYPGSSRVPETLSYFARATGKPQALVAMPRLGDAANLAGMLTAHGLHAVPASAGREAVDEALMMADLELIFVDLSITGPGIRQVLFELRASPTTGAIPIALTAADGRLEDARQLAEEHTRVLATARPHSPEVLARVVEQLRQLAGPRAPAPAERAAQASEAIHWLSRLSKGERPFYKIRRAGPALRSAAYEPVTSEPAIAALARFGTPDSQLALLAIVNQPSLPIEVRTHASGAFAQSVRAHGLLLTTDQIIDQYDRYNASAAADRATQQLLGSVLDAIEARRDDQQVAPLPEP